MTPFQERLVVIIDAQAEKERQTKASKGSTRASHLQRALSLQELATHVQTMPPDHYDLLAVEAVLPDDGNADEEVRHALGAWRGSLPEAFLRSLATQLREARSSA